ncbi:MAG: integrase [Alphaproteobacteria bacterium]|nr:integrase [Alphaproteobacteria bacterium]
MLTEVYDALKDVGANEKKARRAAEALADYQRDISDLRGDTRVLKWIAGTNLAFTMAILWRVFM